MKKIFSSTYLCMAFLILVAVFTAIYTALFVGYVDMVDFEDDFWEPRFFIKNTPSLQIRFPNPIRGSVSNTPLVTRFKQEWAESQIFCKQRFELDIKITSEMEHCIQLQIQDSNRYWGYERYQLNDY